MKTLYLCRHAKSSWRQPELDDRDRPLNKRGKKDAPLMGELLEDKGIRPDLVISSTAKRARKTAAAITAAIGYPESEIVLNEKIYEASVEELLKVIKSIDDKFGSVMIFGHNPALTLLHNYLSTHYIDNIPTCGIVALQFNNSWQDISKSSAKFLFFEYPKLYY